MEIKLNGSDHPRNRSCIVFLRSLFEKVSHLKNLYTHARTHTQKYVPQPTAESLSQLAVTWHNINHTNKLRPAYWNKWNY